MIRSQFFLSIITLCLFSLSSLNGEENTPADKKLLKKENKTAFNPINFNLTIKSYNDAYTYGIIGFNKDDHLSFGQSIGLSINNLFVDLSLNDLTDRYDSLTRVDELRLKGGYSFSLLNKNSPWKLSLDPSIGFVISGDLAGEKLQNFIHGIMKLPKLSLKNLSPTTFSPSLGLRSSLNYKISLPFLDNSFLVPEVYSYLGWEIGYSGLLVGGLSLGFIGDNDYIKLNFEGNYLAYISKKTLFNNVAKDFEALSLELELRQGIFFFSLLNTLKKDGFDLGTLGFSFHNITKKQEFKKADWFTSFGFTLPDKAYITRFDFSLLDLPLSFSVLFRQEGFLYAPVENDVDIGNDRNHFRRQIGGIGFTFNWSPSWKLDDFGWLGIYGGLGFATLHFVSFEKVKDNLVHRPLEGEFIGNIGIRWYGLRLFNDGSVYGLVIGGQFFVPFKEYDSYLLANGNNVAIFTKPRLSLFLGFTVATDL